MSPYRKQAEVTEDPPPDAIKGDPKVLAKRRRRRAGAIILGGLYVVLHVGFGLLAWQALVTILVIEAVAGLLVLGLELYDS